MSKIEENLLNEIHEMRNLMEYMDSKVITENTSAQDLKAKSQELKSGMTGGLANQYEKNAVDALQGIIQKIQSKGSQLTPKIKKYLQLLNNEFEGAGMVKEEDMIQENIADDIIAKYKIDELINKILKHEKISPTLIPVLFDKIGRKYETKNPNEYR